MRKLRWIILGLVGLLVTFVPISSSKAEPVEHVVRIEASSFNFAPAEISVNEGDRVIIKLTSMDVVHGLYLDGYGLQIESDPGQTETLTFTADRPGIFRFRCSVTCGDLHPFMIGKLHVGAGLLFWRGVVLAVLVILGVGVISFNKSQRSSGKP